MRLSPKGGQDIGLFRMREGVAEDLAYLSLIHFCPGAAISDLAKMRGTSPSSAIEHIRVLAMARKVRINHIEGRKKRSIYPRGVLE